MRALLLTLLVASCDGPSPTEAPAQAPPPDLEQPETATAALPRAPRPLPTGPHPRLREWLERVDDDDDGLISQAEHRRWGQAEPGFATMDLNEDGSLDLDELDAALETQGAAYHTARNR